MKALARLLPKDKAGFFDVAVAVVAWGVILAMIAHVLGPLLDRPDTYGLHDWDTMESHRYLTVKSIREFHQFPFWNPYACGGHTNWGNFEGAPNVVSPFLPLYLLLPLMHALRIEIVGTVLLAAVGAWLFAGRFAESRAARAFVVVVWVVNGRWALQTASGHAWHLYYSLLPWALLFFDRASGVGPKPSARPTRDAALAGGALALIVYAGGIYPLPQAAFIVSAYAVLLAITARDASPLRALAVTGLVALGLSAPKLFPLLDMLSRYPRYAHSPEGIDLYAFLQMLTAPGQDRESKPADVPIWAWQEYGMYIGWVPLVVLGAGALVARGPRETPLKWIALGVVALAFGNFHPAAPWNLVHELPIFQSQHVPSRWLYSAPLLLACATAPLFDRALRWRPRARFALEPLLLVGVALVASDIAKESRYPLSHAFTLDLPPGASQRAAEFHQLKNVPPELSFAVRDYYAPSLPAEMAGIGTIECGTFPGLHSRNRNSDPGPGQGAKGLGDPDYRGEAYTASGKGSARIVEFSPNAITVEVDDATPGDVLVLNQNFDAGWSADGERTKNWHDAVATDVRAAHQRVRFRYVPRTLPAALVAFALTVAALVFGRRLARRFA